MSTPILWENFFRKTKQNDVLVLLKEIPIFDELNRRELKTIERILHRRVYQKGEPIFQKGDQGLGMYIIEEGEVDIVAGSAGTRIAHLVDGEFFGELALFSEQPRQASAIALQETRVFGFFQPDLYSLLETHPKIGVSVVLKLAKIMAERVNRIVQENTRLNELATRNTVE